jgi:hypothetical protein
MVAKRVVRQRENQAGQGDTKVMAVADGSGVPIAVHAASASLHKVTLVEGTLVAGFTSGESERLIRDRAYDSDPLDAALKERAIELVAHTVRTGKSRKTRNGRKLRRYAKRWKVTSLTTVRFLSKLFKS